MEMVLRKRTCARCNSDAPTSHNHNHTSALQTATSAPEESSTCDQAPTAATAAGSRRGQFASAASSPTGPGASRLGNGQHEHMSSGDEDLQHQPDVS